MPRCLFKVCKDQRPTAYQGYRLQERRQPRSWHGSSYEHARNLGNGRLRG